LALSTQDDGEPLVPSFVALASVLRSTSWSTATPKTDGAFRLQIARVPSIDPWLKPMAYPCWAGGGQGISGDRWQLGQVPTRRDARNSCSVVLSVSTRPTSECLGSWGVRSAASSSACCVQDLASPPYIFGRTPS